MQINVRFYDKDTASKAAIQLGGKEQGVVVTFVCPVRTTEDQEASSLIRQIEDAGFEWRDYDY